MSEDHKPDNKEEKERIRNAGNLKYIINFSYI